MKKLLLVFLFLSSAIISGQEEIRLMVTQDARLAVTEDKTGNYQPFTTNIYAKLKLTGHQIGGGYLVISPSFEYADIDGQYKRISFDVGYTFNESLRWGLEVTPSVNYGIIDRWGKSFLGFGADLQASIKMNTFWKKFPERLRLTILGQVVDRKELKWAYGSNADRLVFSGFIGFEYSLWKR